MSNVKAYKLLNGMDIVGKVDEEHIGPDIVTLDDAIMLRIVADQNGQPALQFGPLTPFISGNGPAKIVLRKSSVAFEFELEDTYSKAYRQAVSGLILP